MDEGKNEQPKEELAPEQIKSMPGEVRAKMAASEINGVLVKYNCVFQPMLNMGNNGYHIKVDVIGMSYAELPPGTVICFS